MTPPAQHDRVAGGSLEIELEPQVDGHRAELAEMEAKIIKLDGLLYLPAHQRANPITADSAAGLCCAYLSSIAMFAT
jgi:hypothetical protein